MDTKDSQENEAIILDSESTNKDQVYAPKRKKNLPYDLEAEQSCIGSVLIKNSLFDKVFSQLKNVDFYDERHQIIVDCMVKYRIEKGLAPVDIVTLAALLEQKKNCSPAVAENI